MRLKVLDEKIEPEKLFGPIHFSSNSFEKFFVAKAIDLLLKETARKQESDPQFRLISVLETDLNWMYEIELSKSSREQNMEIIYNDNKVYFKTVKTILKDDFLNVFPSKDLEISLGLQFIPFQSDGKYVCKKCSKSFDYQYNLMLHTRYFCTFNINNLLKNYKSQEQSEDANLKKNITKRKLDEPESDNDKKRLKNNPNVHTQNYNMFEFYNSFQTLVQSYSLNQPLRDYLMTQLATYVGNNSKLNSEEKLSEKSSVLLSPSISPYQTVTGQNETTITNEKRETTQNYSINPSLIRKPNFPIVPVTTPNTASTVSFRPPEPKTSVNNLGLQNWCVKCNTHFRLTSDLVYHMRTFHKKEEIKNSVSLMELAIGHKYSDFKDKQREIKYLRCDICKETFKEKHHLTRHLTSHR